ncbi:MAG TPA: STAS domain-containing protein [Tepidisphaeraceae bacterium]|nr:STAS domain-containing protein [Tepidisphaeraceae bacterium]
MSAPSSTYILQQIEKYVVVEFREPSLMDPIVLEQVATNLYHLVDVEDRRYLVLDFEQVQFLSSQALGIVINLKKKLDALGKASLVLCGVGPRLMELLKITRLDRILTVKPSQKEAVKVVPKHA